MILLLAANTAYQDFPRLLFFLARDDYAPRRFLHMGDRLAFSNGIVALSVAAAIIFLAFGGYTESLIPLYAVGVFLAFTLSQAGMVMHWRRHRGRHWQRRAAINGLGAVLCAIVLVTAGVTKFGEGAWVTVLAIPLLVLLALRTRRHYNAVDHALALRPPSVPNQEAGQPAQAGGPRDRAVGGDDQESEESPQDVRHLVVVPVARLNLAALRALAYAASLGPPVFAVHLSPEQEEADRFREEWRTWGDHLRLETIISPYRAITAPLVQYIDALHTLRPDVVLTVVVPELVVKRPWYRLLHTPIDQRLRRALHGLPGVVITSVPFHLSE